MSFSYQAVLAAAVAGFLVGAVWYGLLGKYWTAALGWCDADMRGADGKKKMPLGPMVVCFLAQLVMAAGMAGLIGHLTGGSPTIDAGIVTGVGGWLTFTVTAIAVNNSFQKRPLLLTVIDSGHWLAVLLVQGTVIGWFG